MRKIQFQFSNFGVFDGYTDNVIFRGHPAVYITEGVRQEILEMLEGIKIPSLTTEDWIEEVSTARLNWADNRIPLWGLPVTLIETASVIEYHNMKEMADAQSVQEVLLDGHYFDIVVNDEPAIPVGATRMSKDVPDLRITHHGTYRSVEEARMTLNLHETSDRTSRLPGRQDVDVLNGKVFERKYVSPEHQVGDLSMFVKAIPEEVFRMDEIQVRKWASLVLDEARKVHKDILWYLGSVPLEIRVRKEAAVLIEAAYLDQ